MVDEQIPRLFQLLPGRPEPTPGAEPFAQGVQWPDGKVSVRWIGEFITDAAEWDGFDDPAAADALAGVTVVWRRQDTYVDPEPT